MRSDVLQCRFAVVRKVNCRPTKGAPRILAKRLNGCELSTPLFLARQILAATKMSRTVVCRVCTQDKPYAGTSPYDGDKYAHLGVAGHKSTRICVTCRCAIGKGTPIKLPTQLPLVSPEGTREWGLFASAFVPKGTKMVEYWGEKLDAQAGRERKSFYKWRANSRTIIDAGPVNCLAKYANNTVCILPWFPNSLYSVFFSLVYCFQVRGVFPCNAKLRNIDKISWLIATKDIEAGTEIFFNYGDPDMWKEAKKLKREDLIKKKDDLLLRDNPTEYKRIMEALKPLKTLIKTGITKTTKTTKTPKKENRITLNISPKRRGRPPKVVQEALTKITPQVVPKKRKRTVRRTSYNFLRQVTL